MVTYLKKSRNEILSQALNHVTRQTALSATGPGSMVRALVEAISAELGDMYSILDYNISQSLVSTATGAALDKLGELYNVTRKTVNSLAAIDKKLGAFMFYISQPAGTNILIPKGSNVYTDTTTYIGQRFSYKTTEDAVLQTGRTRVYVTIEPNFSDTIYTAGKNTLVIHDVPQPVGVDLMCTNPKSVAPLNDVETDDQYRTRIIKQIRLTSGGTAEAIRFAGLNVEGVRDVKIRQAPYGMGSFEVIVVPERNMNVTNIFERARASMELVRPIGTRMYTTQPTPLSFDLEVGIIAPMAANGQVRETIVRRVATGISRYLNSLLPGGELVYNQLLQIMMDSSEFVKDVSVKKMAVAGREIMRRNYRPADAEQIVIGDIRVEIISAI